MSEKDIPDRELNEIKEIYQARWKEHGVSPQSLGWTKGKQDIRFDVLLGDIECEGASFLDIGCGFGDLNKSLRARVKNYDYLGLDMVPEFLEQGQKIYGDKRVTFQSGDFLTTDMSRNFDHVIASGIFAFKLNDVDNYDYIKSVLSKMLANASHSVSVDFLSSQVNFERESNFYANPGKILEIAFGLTRNVTLKHDYMPFEFMLRLIKDDSYSDEDTVFNKYKLNL